jgi:hypothetical protein
MNKPVIGYFSKAARENWGYSLVIAPLFAYWAFWTLNPSYWHYADPAAWYFLDSLAPFAGKAYTYVDHPGTPVHLIGTLMLGLAYPLFGGQERLIQYYIAEPETFFFMANLFLLGMNTMTAVFFFKTVKNALKQDGVLAGAALGLMYFAIHPQGFNSLTYWSHNSFNYIFGTLWLLWLVRLAQSGPISRKKISVLGLTAGMLSMTQLYLLTWVACGIITIFLLGISTQKTPGKVIRDGILMTASSLAGMAIMLLPIAGQMPRFIDWISRLLGSQGLYGAGEEAGFYSLNLVPLGLQFWAQHIPSLVFALGLVAGASTFVIWKSRQWPEKASAKDTAIVVGLWIHAALQILVLAKMFYRVRYVLSLAAILPVLLFLTLKIAEQLDWEWKWPRRVLYLGLLFGALFFLGQEMIAQHKRALVEQEAAVARSQAVTMLAQSRGIDSTDLVVVYAFGTPLKCAGLLAANNWIRVFDAEINSLCPNQHALYDFAFDVEFNLTHPVKTTDQIDWDLVIWPGNGSPLPEYLDSVGAVNIRNSWGIARSKWFYIRPERP